MEEMRKDRQGAKGQNRTSWNHVIMQTVKIIFILVTIHNWIAYLLGVIQGKSLQYCDFCF